MIKYIFSIAIIPILLGQHLLLGQSKTQPIKIRINPEFSIGGEASKFIDEIEYIPLVTRDVSISNILQFDQTLNEYIILDKGSNSIIIFSIDGKQKGLITPDFQLSSFTLNRAKNRIEIFNYPNVFEYDLSGKLLNSSKNTKMPYNSLGVIKFNSFFDESIYYNTSVVKSTDSLVYELLTYRSDSLIRRDFPINNHRKIDMLDEIGTVNFHRSVEGSDTINYYVHNYDYQVYEIKETGITPVYQFVFPATLTFPVNFASKSLDDKMKFIKSNNEIVFRLWSFNKYKNLLFFKAGRSTFVYHMQSLKLVDLNKLESDSLSNNMPINMSEMNQSNSILGVNQNDVYIQIPVAFLHEKMSKLKRVNNNDKNTLSDYFKSLSTIDNRPILIRMKFKDQF